MLTALDAHQQRQKLSGLVAELLRAAGRHVENDRHGVAGFGDYALDPQRHKAIRQGSDVDTARTGVGRRRRAAVRSRAKFTHPGHSINYLRLVSSTRYWRRPSMAALAPSWAGSAVDVVVEQFMSGALFDDAAQQFAQGPLL